jgi:Reverse transcriptase (RNA-dependent DNA polymerase)
MNKKIQVIFKNQCLEKISIKRGLRQGCPFSPLLFIIFLEPLLKWLASKNKDYKMELGKVKTHIPYTAFADDIALYNSRTDIMNKYLKMCHDYLHTYNMMFNFDKSFATGNKTSLLPKCGIMKSKNSMK